MYKVIVSLILMVTINLMGNTLPDKCSRDQNINEFTILSYHEIAHKGETLDSTYTVTPEHFREQIQWFVKNGYHFVGVDDILKYRQSGKELPSKAVLLTFDDGYQSVYANAFPVLKEHHIPFVIALVGHWLQAKEKADFDGHMIPRDKFLSQTEIKEMIASGLCEVASHTNMLHRGILGNPQGNKMPAAKVYQWLPDTHKYEDEKSYEKRVSKDLSENNTFLENYTGQKPRVIVWPYGHYNQRARKIAEKLGMPIGLTLDDGSNTKITPLWGLRRILVEGKMSIPDLRINMAARDANVPDDARTTKAAHIDLDYIYDPDPVQQEKNLGALLDRIRSLKVNTVYVQTFADPDANGAADYVYFPNRHIPMRADLFNRVAWQIATRTQVKRVYAWIPMLAWQLPAKNPAVKDTVITLQVDPSHLNMGYPRLSPYSSKARKVIKEVYEDLAKSAIFDGLLFHDDITLSDFEDDSKFARAQYKKWGLYPDVSKIRGDKKQFAKWTKLKTQQLDQFAMELAQIVRNEQPGLKTARNLYAQVALNDNAEEWYAQNLGESIKHYDYTAIMAMPYMEQAENHTEFYKDIVKNVKAHECGMERTVMEIQTVDWRKESIPLPPKEISDTIRYLYSLGVHHIAYYPDNVYLNNPNDERTREDFSEKDLRFRTLTLPHQ